MMDEIKYRIDNRGAMIISICPEGLREAGKDRERDGFAENGDRSRVTELGHRLRDGCTSPFLVEELLFSVAIL